MPDVALAGPVAWPTAAAKRRPLESHGLWMSTWLRLRRDRLTMLALTVFSVIVVLTLLAPVISSQLLRADPFRIDLVSRYEPPSAEHLLGTDDLGRDVPGELRVPLSRDRRQATRQVEVMQLGGEQGPIETIAAGDVIIIPAGVGHKNLGASRDFHVVGAYPPRQKVDLCYGKSDERPRTDENIARVALPVSDPVFGKTGPLLEHWRKPA